VRQFLGSGIAVLELISQRPLSSGAHVNAAVWNAKKAILEALSRRRANVIHLFLAVPSEFAVFFGHRLNATGLVQCYERAAPNEYVSTCRLHLS
jgi:hypothetical protein